MVCAQHGDRDSTTNVVHGDSRASNSRNGQDWRYRVRSSPGFTLIELLILCACLAIALQLTAAPFTGAIAEARSAAAMRHLSSLLAFARQEAILRGTTVTVCALTAGDHCSRHWSSDRRIAVFIDADRDRNFTSGEILLRELRWPMREGELSWRASLARQYIEFERTGATWQNGTLYYCPASRTRDRRAPSCSATAGAVICRETPTLTVSARTAAAATCAASRRRSA